MGEFTCEQQQLHEQTVQAKDWEIVGFGCYPAAAPWLEFVEFMQAPWCDTSALDEPDKYSRTLHLIAQVDDQRQQFTHIRQFAPHRSRSCLSASASGWN
jgi:hypothetical protein